MKKIAMFTMGTRGGRSAIHISVKRIDQKRIRRHFGFASLLEESDRGF